MNEVGFDSQRTLNSKPFIIVSLSVVYKVLRVNMVLKHKVSFQPSSCVCKVSFQPRSVPLGPEFMLKKILCMNGQSDTAPSGRYEQLPVGNSVG